MNRITKLAAAVAAAGLLSLGMAAPSYAWQGPNIYSPTHGATAAYGAPHHAQTGPDHAHSGMRYGTRREAYGLGNRAYAYAPQQQFDSSSNASSDQMPCAVCY